MTPNLTSLPGPANEPWCWTEQKLTADPGNVNHGPRRFTTERKYFVTICNSWEQTLFRRTYGQPGVVDGPAPGRPKPGVALPHLRLSDGDREPVTPGTRTGRQAAWPFVCLF